MRELHKPFLKAMTKIGFKNTELPTAVFYSVPIGIRFEIGGQEGVYLPNDKDMNPIYVENAFCRAKALFRDLPCVPNILRIDSYPEETDKITLEILEQLGITAPNEIRQEQSIDEGTCFLKEHLYWDLAKGNFQIDKLILEIIKSDIGGNAELCSSVYLLNTEKSLLYHLYDDRGADIVAFDKYLLLSLYRKYGSWILKHDKAGIDKIFAD